MRKILVSECLYGGRAVRYDAKCIPCEHPTFLKWKGEGRFIYICPEVFGGLSTPRPASQRRSNEIFTETGDNVTEEYTIGAIEALRLAKEYDVAFAIMKESSPSCGSKEIYDGTFSNTKIPGQGLANETIRKAGFIVFNEHEIDEAEEYLLRVEKK